MKTVGKIVLIVVIVIAFGSMITAAVLESRAKKREEATLARLKTLGLQPDRCMVGPVPVVDVPDPNGADLYREAWVYQEPMFDSTKDVPDLIGISRHERDDRWDSNQPVSDTEVAAATALFVAYDGLIPKLQAAAAVPECTFVTDWSDGPTVMLPHLSMMRQSANILGLHMIEAASRGESEVVLDDLALGCKIARAPQSDRTMISYLVGYAVVVIMMDRLELSLTLAELSESELATAQGLIAGCRGGADYDQAMLGELELMLAFYEDPSRFSDRGTAVESGKLPYFLTAGRRFAIEHVGLRFPAVEQSPIERQQIAVDLERHNDEAAWYLFIGKMLSTSGDNVGNRDARFATSINCAVVALAAERYRLRTGEWPADLAALDDLVPPENRIDWLDVDPTAFADLAEATAYTPKPVKMKRTEQGIMIYSVGPDRTDDGGHRMLRDQRKKPYDLVFEIRRPIPVVE